MAFGTRKSAGAFFGACMWFVLNQIRRCENCFPKPLDMSARICKGGYGRSEAPVDPLIEILQVGIFCCTCWAWRQICACWEAAGRRLQRSAAEPGHRIGQHRRWQLPQRHSCMERALRVLEALCKVIFRQLLAAEEFPDRSERPVQRDASIQQQPGHQDRAVPPPRCRQLAGRSGRSGPVGAADGLPEQRGGRGAARGRAVAKIRTGGETLDRIPASLAACRRRRCPDRSYPCRSVQPISQWRSYNVTATSA